jgi:flagellar FliJ protein
MRRFHFSLGKILELREHLEREAKLALGRAVGELAAIENRIRELALLRRRAWEEYRNPPLSPPAGNLADYYRNCEHYIRRLDQTKEELLQKAAEAQARVEEARATYLEASRERKVLDKLKEKQAAAYRKESFAVEVKTLDDMARPPWPERGA